MDKDYLVSMVDIDCPFCNTTHLLEQRKRLTQSIVQDEIVDYEEIYFLCPLIDGEENEFVPSGLMDENLLRARDAYKKTRSNKMNPNDIYGWYLFFANQCKYTFKNKESNQEITVTADSYDEAKHLLVKFIQSEVENSI